MYQDLMQKINEAVSTEYTLEKKSFLEGGNYGARNDKEPSVEEIHRMFPDLNADAFLSGFRHAQRTKTKHKPVNLVDRDGKFIRGPFTSSINAIMWADYFLPKGMKYDLAEA